MSEQITLGFKGHDKDLKCRDFQYEIGIEAEMDKDKTLNVCPSNDTEGGLHFCKNPLDVFLYYKPTNGNRFTLVEGIGEAMTHSVDSKVAVRRLKIIKELSLKDIISESVKFIINNSTAATSGGNSTAATSGYRLTAATSGDYSITATSGPRSTAATSGDYSRAATSGFQSTAATSGNYSTAATTGAESTAATSGNYSTAATSGFQSTAATSGYVSTATTTGAESTAATSGNYSTAATSGFQSTAATSGYVSTATTSGDYSVALANGADSTSEVTGNNSIAVAFGNNSKAKGILGSWLVLTEMNNGKLNVVSFEIDDVNYLSDTFYKLLNGKIIKIN